MAVRDTTPIIPNTTMQIYTNGQGVDLAYYITPIEGYVIHDKARDFQAVDPDTFDPLFDENGDPIMVQGFTTATASCGLNYDFEANPREFFTKPENEVPADQIFGGGGNNDHEIM